MARKLDRTFYDRPTLEVCEELIGQRLVYRSPDGNLSARVVEVEAYIGQGDPACHAARGKTGRNRVMFGKPGFAYIYLIYGMYNCLNLVTEAEGHPAAVLIRGVEPLEGLELMRVRSKTKQDWQLCNGPGKLCRSFGLTREQNGLDLTGDKLYLEPMSVGDNSGGRPRIVKSTRIGISAGQEKLWRFYDANSQAVSKMPKPKASVQ